MTDARDPGAATPSRIDCETAVRRLWDYLDGELDPPRAAEVERHLAVCRLCPPHFGFARTLVRAVEATERADAPPDALRARVVAALRAEGYEGGAG